MKNVLIVLPLVGILAACATQEQETLAGAAVGATAGAIIGDTEGALIGGLAGAVIGANLNTGAKRSCVYTEPDGTKYNAPCP